MEGIYWRENSWCLNKEIVDCYDFILLFVVIRVYFGFSFIELKFIINIVESMVYLNNYRRDFIFLVILDFYLKNDILIFYS